MKSDLENGSINEPAMLKVVSPDLWSVKHEKARAELKQTVDCIINEIKAKELAVNL
jgi:tRNA threonylcarbamoyladenosine modification (KEOPS) complex  Pcc1 subunit